MRRHATAGGSAPGIHSKAQMLAAFGLSYCAIDGRSRTRDSLRFALSLDGQTPLDEPAVRVPDHGQCMKAVPAVRSFSFAGFYLGARLRPRSAGTRADRGQPLCLANADGLALTDRPIRRESRSTRSGRAAVPIARR